MLQRHKKTNPALQLGTGYRSAQSSNSRSLAASRQQNNEEAEKDSPTTISNVFFDYTTHISPVSDEEDSFDFQEKGEYCFALQSIQESGR